MIATDFDDADVSRLNPDRNADRFDAERFGTCGI
jgi:hypothetical protein